MTLEDDVLGIVSRVRQLYDGKVTVELDDHNGKFHFVEHADGTDRLIFTVDELDQRALDRLVAADSQSRGYEDPYLAAERAQDEAQARQDDGFKEEVAMAGEELLFHLQREGRAPFLTKQVFVPKDLDADS
jgi:hypothetical protein